VRPRSGAVQVRVSAVLPGTPEQVWALLSDTPRMVAADPLFEAFEPELGVITEGTTNRITTRLGPVRLRATSRTEVLEPPRRATFVSVRPARPVHLRSEETLAAVIGDRCRYEVVSTLTPTVPVVGHLAARLMGANIRWSRRRLVGALRAMLVADRAATTI
jgi:hypothetical protein